MRTFEHVINEVKDQSINLPYIAFCHYLPISMLVKVLRHRSKITLVCFAFIYLSVC